MNPKGITEIQNDDRSDVVKDKLKWNIFYIFLSFIELFLKWEKNMDILHFRSSQVLMCEREKLENNDKDEVF